MFNILILIAAITLLPSPSPAVDYTITVGDKLAINILEEPEYSTEAVVRPDGIITLRNGGDIVARGLTPAQLQDEVAKKLRELIRNPAVTVTVSQFNNTKAFILGGGVKTGSVDVTACPSLLQLLTGIEDMAGADLRKGSLLRDGKPLKEDLYALYWGDTAQDVPLKPGDTVVIPPAAGKGVYVVGAVAAPKTVPYREGMTLLEAVLEAGGFNKFASPNKTKIVRRENGEEKIIKVKADRLIHDGDLSQNIPLKSGDLVIVEEGFF